MEEDYSVRRWEDGGEGILMDEEENLTPEEVQEQCIQQFSSTDFIMEPGIFSTLERYFQAGGDPAQVIEMLSVNYEAVAQMANLMAEWLILAGASINDVQAMVESHLKDLILKTFDPKKADMIFNNEERDAPAWLTQLIEHNTWRSVVYQLAEEFPDCLMLNLTIKLISDAGFQGEITSVSTAAQQIEVFSRILKTSTANYLISPEDTRHRAVEELAEMKGGNNIRRLQQEIARYAIKSGYNITPIQLALYGANSHPRVAQALAPMLSKNALNPADITVLYKLYSSQDPPPVDLIRIPQFLELLIDALFKPGSKVNPEHKNKYIYLLAYAASVYEIPRKGTKPRQVNKDDLKLSQQSIEKVNEICQGGKSALELIAEIGSLYQAIRHPVVSVGLVRWVECVVKEPSFFNLCTETTPTHLALLDEVASIHPLLHMPILRILIELFESEQSDLEILVQLELRKMLLDRMVNLLSKGCVIPVLKYIKNCHEKDDTDISLIRYFVKEVLEIVAPPYSGEFVQLFLPLVENDEITGPMRLSGEGDPVSDFIGHCKSNYILMT